MRKAKKVLSVFLSLSLMFSMLACVTFGVSAATQTAVCTVAVSEQNVGTDDYYIAADVTFESDVAFIAGIFKAEAQNLELTGCTATSCTGGDAPEIYPDYDANKIIFAGFSESTAQDYRSYTALTLRLKFTAETRPTSAVVVDIKNISITNYDEELYTTANAQGTLHIHSFGEEWVTDETYHWHTCSICSEVGDKAAHTFDALVSNPTCTEAGYTTYTCTVCGYSYNGDNVEPSDHNFGDWLSDDDNHWKECSVCHEKAESGAHIASDWIIDQAATTEAAGSKHKECTVCGKVLETEEIPILAVSHTPGDINGDGKVNNKDLTRLFQYLSDWDVEVTEAALDVNGDGKINNKDLTRLFQYLSDWEVEIF